MISERIWRWVMVTLLVLLLSIGSAAIAQTTTGRLDFLKSKDSAFALFANTSGTLQPGNQYPNEVVLITGRDSTQVKREYACRHTALGEGVI